MKKIWVTQAGNSKNKTFTIATIRNFTKFDKLLNRGMFYLAQQQLKFSYPITDGKQADNPGMTETAPY